MIRYIGRQGVPGNVQQAFNILRKQFLKPFPSTKGQKRTFPNLIIMGYTSEIVNVVRLRGLLVRPNILSHIPPTCQAFKECIVKSIPCFKYGDTMDGTFLNTSNEARERSELFFPCFPKEKKPLHNGSYEHRVPKIKNQTLFCTRDFCVIQHRNWPLRSTILKTCYWFNNAFPES